MIIIKQIFGIRTKLLGLVIKLMRDFCLGVISELISEHPAHWMSLRWCA